MSSTEHAREEQAKSDSDQSLKLAIAMALLRSKILRKKSSPNSSSSTVPSESDAQRWKRKAKERKKELLRLKEDLKEAEDGVQHDLFPQSASCKCYFFNHLGKLSPKGFRDGSDRRFNDVLRRRFLRHVRLKEQRRRRIGGLIQPLQFSDLNNGNEIEQLRASVDFLVELCENVSPLEEANFTNWSHQAVDFILASLKDLLSTRKNMEDIEGIVSCLITRLVRRMCAPSQGDDSGADLGFYVEHLLRKLGSESYVGQRTILCVSERISVVAESLLFMDPFDDAFPNMHNCLFIMIQLTELLVSDYLLAWSRDESFDAMVFEEWVTSVVHAKKAIEVLESRNELYVVYMDRVTGELAKQMGQVSCLEKLDPGILDKLLH